MTSVSWDIIWSWAGSQEFKLLLGPVFLVSFLGSPVYTKSSFNLFYSQKLALSCPYFSMVDQLV